MKITRQINVGRYLHVVPHDLAGPRVEDGAAVTWVVARDAFRASEPQRSYVIL